MVGVLGWAGMLDMYCTVEEYERDHTIIIIIIIEGILWYYWPSLIQNCFARTVHDNERPFRTS